MPSLCLPPVKADQQSKATSMASSTSTPSLPPAAPTPHTPTAEPAASEPMDVSAPAKLQSSGLLASTPDTPLSQVGCADQQNCVGVGVGVSVCVHGPWRPAALCTSECVWVRGPCSGMHTSSTVGVCLGERACTPAALSARVPECACMALHAFIPCATYGSG